MAINGRTLIPDEVAQRVDVDPFECDVHDLTAYPRSWLLAVRGQVEAAKRSAFTAMQDTLANAGDRALTRNQQAGFDGHAADLDLLGELRTRIDDAMPNAWPEPPSDAEQAADALALTNRWRAADGLPALTAEQRRLQVNNGGAPLDPSSGRTTMTTTPTERGAVLAPEHRVADYVRARGIDDPHTERLNLGKALRGMVTGSWAGADAERRAMAEGTNSAGGFLVPTILSSEIIDLARNAARVIEAGARTVPMESQVENVARQITDPAVTWRLENASINNSGPTFDLLAFVAKSLACVTTVSRELVEDSKMDIHDLLLSVISKAIALEIDRVGLRGSGIAPEPQGVRNTPNVPVTSLGTNGAAASWDAISSAVQLIRGANFEPTAALYTPRTAGGLARQKDAQGRYLAPPVDLDGLPLLPTAQIRNDLTQGTSSVASELYVGDWAQLWIGVRTQLQITILQERYADLGQIGLVAWWRGDVQVAHPLAFNVLTGAL